MSSEQHNYHTGFPETEAWIRWSFGNARVDWESLEAPLNPCALARCHGACCHDGVYLSTEEAQMLDWLAEEEADFFREGTPDFPRHPLEREVDAQGNVRFRTARRDFPHRRETEDWPAHFPETACIFLDGEHRCQLQVLAVERGHHPWYWKPFNCWLHPLTFVEEGGVRRLVLPGPENDPHAQEDYPGFASVTACGKRCEGGRPAREVLAPELDFLGKILEWEDLTERPGN